MTHFQECDRPGEIMLSEPYFIIVQEGEVIDSAQHPAAMFWTAVDPQLPFKVAIGVIDEVGHKEIVGVCAEFKKNDGDTFYITSDTDGYMRMIVCDDDAVEIIKTRICQLYAMKRFSDPFNFSKVKLYQGGCMG